MKFRIAESFNLKDLDFEKTFVNAGAAFKAGTREEDVDAKELKMGIEVEMEHTTNREIAKRIALDHLSENIPDYYTRLAKMEEEGKKEGAEVKGGKDAEKDSEEDKEDEDKSGDDASEKNDEEDEKSEKSGASMKV
jgi:hypothetical protein